MLTYLYDVSNPRRQTELLTLCETDAQSHRAGDDIFIRYVDLKEGVVAGGGGVLKHRSPLRRDDVPLLAGCVSRRASPASKTVWYCSTCRSVCNPAAQPYETRWPREKDRQLLSHSAKCCPLAIESVHHVCRARARTLAALGTSDDKIETLA